MREENEWHGGLELGLEQAESGGLGSAGSE